MKFIHAADLHLRAAESAERLKALENIVGVAREHDADFIFFTGDLFDSDHDAGLLRPQVRQILEGWDRPTVLLAGNHDIRSYEPTADYGRKALLAQGSLQVFDGLGELPVVCLPYRDKGSFADIREELSLLKGPLVVGCHGTLFLSQWLGWLREEKEDVGDYFPIFPEDLEGLPIRYLALGHFHRRFYHAGKPVLCCYPGSAYPVTARELGPRSVALVQLESQSAQVNAIPLKSVPWFHQIDLRCLPWREEELFSGLEEALAAMEPQARPVVNATGYARDERGVRERLEKRLASSGGPKPRVALFDYSRLMENAFYRLFVEEIHRRSSEEDLAAQAIDEKALEIVTLGFSRLQKGR